MEKRNVVNDKLTPEHELKRTDADWDKRAAESFSAKLDTSDTSTSKPGGSKDV